MLLNYSMNLKGMYLRYPFKYLISKTNPVTRETLPNSALTETLLSRDLLLPVKRPGERNFLNNSTSFSE